MDSVYGEMLNVALQMGESCVCLCVCVCVCVLVCVCVCVCVYSSIPEETLRKDLHNLLNTIDHQEQKEGGKDANFFPTRKTRS